MPVNADDGLEDIRWIRALGGEKLPAASYALLPNLKKGLLFAIGEGSRIFVACFLHSSAQMCLYQTPGRRPPPITGRFVNTVTRGWVGAPNERAPFRFHGAVVGFVHRCLSRTRNLAATSKHLAEFFSGRSWSRSAQDFFFFGVFEKFQTFFSKICAHSERYINLFADVFEILDFLWKHRVSIVTGIILRIISRLHLLLIEYICYQNPPKPSLLKLKCSRYLHVSEQSFSSVLVIHSYHGIYVS